VKMAQATHLSFGQAKENLSSQLCVIHDSPNRNAALVSGLNVGPAVETAKIIITAMAAIRA
jgi:hypothetical protein